VDRRYIEQFLAQHSHDIRGRVLEIGDNAYTMRFGADQVEISDVFNRFPGAAHSTFTGDLAAGGGLPRDEFDCIIVTQTLQLIFEVNLAVRALWRALRPGGVLLVTVPWVSPMDRSEWVESWYWSFSPAALRRLLEAHFDISRVVATSYGNVLSATAFMYGLAEHELTPAELDANDAFCPVLVAARAQK
jgi:SAM-dependent methyltransferase